MTAPPARRVLASIWISVLFPTTDFAIFFGIVFVVNWLVTPHTRAWKAFIVVASYVFYAWWDWRFVFLLAASTVINAAGGRMIAHFADDRRRRTALVLTITADLGILSWFKYAGFFAASADNVLRRLGASGAPVPIPTVTLPIAISFFTFMAMSYVIDIYRGDLEPATFTDFAVYLSFFPHLLSGPIVRGHDLLPQIVDAEHRDPRRLDFPRAAGLILGGLFKKVVVSSYVSTAIVTPVFDTPSAHSAPEILLAVYGYAVQIYCDFSGYTDIAIGCALLLGFRFPQNFDMPYSARSVQEFWRRWHMTLSSWLRDYLYVPLGGNRRGRRATYRNLMLTMLLGGLWHGAAWTFVAWGGIHGFALCVGHVRGERRRARGLPDRDPAPGRVLLQRVATFHVVCFGWIFFASPTLNGALTLCWRLVSTWGQAAPLFRLPVAAAVAGGLALQFAPAAWRSGLRTWFGRLHPAPQAVALASALLVTTTLGPAGVAPFIYYKF